MTIDLGQIITIIGMLCVGAASLAGVVWKLVTYINDVSEKLTTKINEVDQKRSANVVALHTKIDDTAESLDGKFNVVRSLQDQIKQDYVRRDDLDGHLARFEKSLEQITMALDRVRVRFDEGFLELVRALALRMEPPR